MIRHYNGNKIGPFAAIRWLVGDAERKTVDKSTGQPRGGHRLWLAVPSGEEEVSF